MWLLAIINAVAAIAVVLTVLFQGGEESRCLPSRRTPADGVSHSNNKKGGDRYG